MSKYSYEFKLKVIKYYLEEHHSYRECCKKFDIPDKTQIQQWVHKYELYGSKGIIKCLKSSYNGDFKKNVIEYMHSNHLSARRTADIFRLGCAAVRGRTRKMSSKSNNKKLDKKDEKDLLAEVEQLRMENEYLKKLNALVQERIKRENKKK